MWDLPGPGIGPVSPALAGRFFTTEPPGKPPVPYLIPSSSPFWGTGFLLGFCPFANATSSAWKKHRFICTSTDIHQQMFIYRWNLFVYRWNLTRPRWSVSSSFSQQITNICWIIEKARESKNKHLLLLHWPCQTLWLCRSQQTVENSSRDGNTRPPNLSPENPVCRSSNRTLHEQLVQNWVRSMTRLYIVSLFI